MSDVRFFVRPAFRLFNIREANPVSLRSPAPSRGRGWWGRPSRIVISSEVEKSSNDWEIERLRDWETRDIRHQTSDVRFYSHDMLSAAQHT